MWGPHEPTVCMMDGQVIDVMLIINMAQNFI